MTENKYVESNVQKGFWDNISGCYEHTETFISVINHARRKQCNLVVTLIDLKNAFGEIDHKLLAEVIKYHKVPDHQLVTDCIISVVTDSYLTSLIKVRRGVLQGGSLSPLLFNLIVNTLISTMKQEKLKYMGYVNDGGIQPKIWMQFVDDAAFVAALKRDYQLLFNGFLKWSNCAGLIVRVDKCSVFGINKSKTESAQYQPYVTINPERIRPIKNGDSFTYLGKDFNFNMNCDHVKENLMKTIREYTNSIDTLPIHPLCKIEICQKYVYSKIKLSIYDLSETWVKEDSCLNRLYRKWLQLPISANITHL